MSRRADASTLLERALVADAARSGVTVRIVASGATRWASATFVGARHRLVLSGDGAESADWLGGLADADLPCRGHLVADLIVVDRTVANGRFDATIEVLTVEEA